MTTSLANGVLDVPPAALQADHIGQISRSTQLQRDYYDRWHYWVEHITIKAHMGMFDPDLLELCTRNKVQSERVSTASQSAIQKLASKLSAM